MRNLLTALILAVTAAFAGTAQGLLWSVDFNTVFNNREGGDELRPDQTIFFTRLAPEVGLALDRDTTHRVAGGVAWYQPVADDYTGFRVLPTLYYRYRSPRWSGAVGLLPRTLLQEPLPRLLMSDSLNYCQPNIRGAVVCRHLPRNGYVQLMFDWRQLPTAHRREAFCVLLSANAALGRSPLRAKALVYYNHLAKRNTLIIGEGVVDDATILPSLLLDLDGRTALSRLQVEAGLTLQLQRCRADGLGNWHTPCALMAAARASWWRLDAETTLHAGANLFPLYPIFGPELNLGDPYYCSEFYSRTDLRLHLVSTPLVDVSASLTFHATESITGFWQQLSCRVLLDQNMKRTTRPLQPLF